MISLKEVNIKLLGDIHYVPWCDIFGKPIIVFCHMILGKECFRLLIYLFSSSKLHFKVYCFVSPSICIFFPKEKV